MKYFLFILFFVLIVINGYAQNIPQAQRVDSELNRDTIKQGKPVPLSTDTAKQTTDSIKQAVQKPLLDTSYYKLLNNPFLPKISHPIYLVIKERERPSKDQLFYLVSALMLFGAFIKLVFPKYFQNMFRLFFQPTFRQKQTREQLLQNNLPAFLYNLFFIFAAGAYVALLAQYFKVANENFVILFLYSTALLAISYIIKYIFITFSGWVFNAKEASDTYIFVVYLINKIMGILLIPFILILAFSRKQVIDVGITVSILLISLLFLYRYIISYAPVKREIKVSPLHFFLYICAFEITPLLLIYKVLAIYLKGTL